MKKEYPYQNLSLHDMEGEIWKDVPNYAGYYQVSNFGRVKRLAHVVTHRLGSQPVRTIIRNQIVGKSYNAYMKDYTFHLRFAASVQGRTENFNTARLVYHCFVEPFDMKDRNTFVYFKDEDPFNIQPENLYLANQADKQRRMEARGRRGTPFLDMTPEKRKWVQEKIRRIRAQKTVDQISQYDADGRLIQTFHNASVAGKTLGINPRRIAYAATEARKKVLTAGGFLWRRGTARQIDISPMLSSPGVHRTILAKHLKRVGQYDLDGNLIRTFPSKKAAAKMLGFNFQQIIDATKGHSLTYRGYLWRENPVAKIDVKPLLKGREHRITPLSAKCRVVTQYNLDGIRIRTFATKTEAAKLTGTDSTSITDATTGKAMTAGGYLWQLGEALRLDIRKLTKSPRFKRSQLEKHLAEKRRKNLEKIDGRNKG